MAKMQELLGYRLTPAQSLSGKIAVKLELFPRVKPRAGQTEKEAGEKHAVVFRMDEATIVQMMVELTRKLEQARKIPGQQSQH